MTENTQFSPEERKHRKMFRTRGNVHCRDVLPRECIGGVADEKTGLTHSTVADYHTLDRLHFAPLLSYLTETEVGCSLQDTPLDCQCTP
jgi:hypothetical protein